MLSAVEAVRKGTVSINKGALLHSVSCTMLRSGRVVHEVKPGPRTEKEETLLSNNLAEACKAGYGKTCRQVKLIVESVAREKGTLKFRHISDGWWCRLLERQPHSSL